MTNLVRPDYYVATVMVEGGQPVDIECVDVIDALGLGFRLGSALKYLWRAGKKTPDRVSDLKKARTFIDSEIARLARVERAVTDSAAVAVGDISGTHFP